MLGHCFCTRGDQGKRSSMKSRFLSSICFGISVRSSSRYLYVFIWFALAVSTRLYRIALALAPFSDSIMTKFLRPIVNGLIALSAIYSYIRINCLMHTRFLSSSLSKVRLNMMNSLVKMRITFTSIRRFWRVHLHHQATGAFPHLTQD